MNGGWRKLSLVEDAGHDVQVAGLILSITKQNVELSDF
jgi:hypothetical protein